MLALGGTLALAQAVAGVFVNPGMLSVAQGQTSLEFEVSVRFARSGTGSGHGFLGVSLPPGVPGLRVEPASVSYRWTLDGNGQGAGNISFRIATTTATAPGSYPITIVDLTNDAGSTSATILVTAAGVQKPRVDRVIPSRISAGSRSMTLRLIGRNFEPGATVNFNSSFVMVESVRVFTSNLAEVIVSVRSDAPASVTGLSLVNPSGQVGVNELSIALLPTNSPGAPLGVTSVVVIYPRPGSQITEDEAVYPRGLLATTGSGTITGSWLLDGFVFDRFTLTVLAGRPTPVTSHVPIPQSFRGTHNLLLEIDRPQRLASPSVLIVQTVGRGPEVRFVSPPDGLVVGTMPQEFRWTPVPGVAAYEIEFERPPPASPLAYRTTEPRWILTAGLLKEIGTGLQRWRVRTLFPGDVPHVSTEWRRLAILPEKVALTLDSPRYDTTSGRSSISWMGGAAGVVYLVELRSSDGSETVYSGLTARAELSLSPAVVPPGRYRLRVTALGPDGEGLGSSEMAISLGQPGNRGSPHEGGRAHAGYGARIAMVSEIEVIRVQELKPSDGSILESDRPRVQVTWTGEVSLDEVFLEVDSTDVTSLALLTAGTLSYTPIFALEPGEHTLMLSLAGQITRWSFTVASRPEQAPEPETGAAGAHRERKPVRWEWRANAEGAITVVGGDAVPDQQSDPNLAQLALSGQADFERPDISMQATGDVSLTRELSGMRRTGQDNENWVVHSAGQWGNTAANVAVGYRMPSFLDGTEFLSAGLTRGGVEVSVARTGIFNASLYHSFEPEVGNITSGDFDTEQTFRAVGFEFGGGARRYMIRVLGIDVKEKGGFEPGGDGTSFGIFGSYSFASSTTLIFEGARGDFEPAKGSAEVARQGTALRLGLRIQKGRQSYSAQIRHIDADFVNPANRGFTPGGRADRDEIEGAYSRQGEKSALNFTILNQRGGDSLGPEARVTATTAAFSRRLGERVRLSLTGNLASTDADADEQLFIEEVSQQDKGLLLSPSESLGKLQLSQSLSVQWHDDHNRPEEDTMTTNANFTASGSPVKNLLIAGTIDATKTDADAEIGETTSFLVSLQPAYEVPRAWLSIKPYLSYSELTNDTQSLEMVGEQYLMRVIWTPPWIASLLSLDLSADWSRMRDRTSDTSTDFAARYTASLIIRWGRSGSRANQQAASSTRRRPPAPSRTWSARSLFPQAPRGSQLARLTDGP